MLILACDSLFLCYVPTPVILSMAVSRIKRIDRYVKIRN
jgi:hypothetical protein